jgi:hypothetical protein
LRVNAKPNRHCAIHREPVGLAVLSFHSTATTLNKVEQARAYCRY